MYDKIFEEALMKTTNPKFLGETWWMVFALLAASLACSTSAPPTPVVDHAATATMQSLAVQQTQVAMQATEVALSEAMTRVAASPTPEPTSTPVPTATPIPTATVTPGPLVIEDDFSKDVGRWVECKECFVANGVLYMGPFPSADSAEGYTVICKDCGVVDEYKMEVDVTYVSGASDRGFGLVLWEDDGYYIDLEITTWQTYGVWFYDKDKGKSWNAWYYLLDKPFKQSGNIRAGKLTNRIAVEVENRGGQRLATISVNGKTLQNNLELKVGPGWVGFVVGLHSLGVSFDNFYFEGIPIKSPRPSGNEG